MNDLFFYVGYGGAGVAVFLVETRLHSRRRSTYRSAAGRIYDALVAYKHHVIAEDMRTGLKPEDVEFLRYRGWEPETPDLRRLAIGIEPAPGLGMRAIEAPKPPPKPLEGTIDDPRPRTSAAGSSITVSQYQTAMNAQRNSFYYANGFYPNDDRQATR